jgi:DNA polymerase-1
MIDLIEKVRELLKLKNTYVDALPKLIDANSYLHTSLHQDVTSTGRLSSTNPNLQNIPTRTELGSELRRSFVASPGKVLVNADYSQFELRLAAAMAGDTNLIEDFQDDSVDIHTKTAAEAYGVALEDVTPEMRRHAKVINFGVLYGMSPHGLAAATGMSFAQAKQFIERYFRVRAPIRDFIDRTIEKAKTDGYVETYFGRRRPTPDVRSGSFIVRQAAKRAAANMPMQGTEADLMKMAMLKIDEQLGSVAEQILQIHDSIMVETDPDQAETVAAKMKEIMENIYPAIGVRLKVDVKIGQNWGEL